MLNISSLRYRYTQLFVLSLIGALVYMMARGSISGITYFEDNLYKKDFLIEKANFLRIKMGDRVFPKALLGKDGWMEFTGSNLDDFQNTRTLKVKKVFGKMLINLNQYLKSQGITLLIVIAPNKATIYPDKLPQQIKPLSTQSRLDRLVYFSDNINLPVVDLRPALRTARQDEDVYFKTDTHWNGYGAFVVYTTIINTLESSYPELKPYKSTDLELVTTNPGVRDISRMIRANFFTEPDFFFAPKEPFVQTSHPGDYTGYNTYSSIRESELPTLLMFHDSFGAAHLNDYLSMNFGKSHFFHVQSMPKYLTQETIQQFKPDAIIIEIVERDLEQLVYYLSKFAPK